MGCKSCGKKTCCCPTTIRGKDGPMGPRGPIGLTGPTGPPGPSGVPSIPVEQAFNPDQTIRVTIAPVTAMVTGSETPALAAGNYCVWVEHDWLNAADDTLGTYAIYVNGNPVGTARNMGTTDSINDPMPLHTMFKSAIFHIVAVGASQTISLYYTLTAGAAGMKKGSIIYQKIS